MDISLQNLVPEAKFLEETRYIVAAKHVHSGSIITQ